MRVEAGGDADVGVSGKFPPLKEQGRHRAQQVVEADAAQPCAVEESTKVPGGVGGVERAARLGW